jgi:hypothetical protein
LADLDLSEFEFHKTAATKNGAKQMPRTKGRKPAQNKQKLKKALVASARGAMDRLQHNILLTRLSLSYE